MNTKNTTIGLWMKALLLSYVGWLVVRHNPIRYKWLSTDFTANSGGKHIIGFIEFIVYKIALVVLVVVVVVVVLYSIQAHI